PAPAAGLVTEVRAAVGAPASPQAGPMFRISVNNEIELEAEVPSVHLLKLNPGATVRISRDDAPDVVGKVRQISPQIDRTTQLGKVRIALTNNPSLKVGMFARANIDAKRSCGIAVPRTAIDHLTVQVIKGNTVETRKVRVGLTSDTNTEILEGLEDGVSGVEGVRHISSSITDGLSVTTIQFALETNTDRALNDVKDAVTRVRANLPQNVNEPLIQRVDVIGLPILTYAAISPGKTPEQLSYFVDDVVKRALQGVRGVAQVERIGGVEREILVSLDPDRLQAAGLTAVNVSQILRGTNVDVAGGRAQIGKNDQAIRTLAGAKTLNELAGTMIPLFGGGEVRLDDLGTVTDTIADRSTFARFNGEPVVALGIKRSKGASDVVVAAAVQKRIETLKAAYPDVDLKLIDTSVEFTKGNYDAAISTLFEGAILAVIVVLLFLRDIRATIIAAISLPLSIFPAFWAMDLLGFSLNLVSFLAITLST